MSLIEIRNLKKEYDNAVPLRGINADIEEGEVISIIGPSGTGKSTLLRCINRLETPTSGTVTVDGVNVCDPSADLPKVRRIMGMVFQSFNLFPHKMAVENIMIPQQSLLGKSPQDAYSEAMEQLARVGLADKARHYPDELSGGQKQRVAIARALAMHPKILLFDEPTSALDPTMVSEVLSVIRDLAGTGLTMLIVTHEMRLAKNVSDRIFFMNEGEICEEGPPEQIFENPLREATRNFIFRIRNWNYKLSPTEQDFPAMMENSARTSSWADARQTTASLPWRNWHHPSSCPRLTGPSRAPSPSLSRPGKKVPTASSRLTEAISPSGKQSRTS